MGSRFAIIDPQKVRLKVKSQQTKLGSQKTKIDFIDTHQKNYIYDVWLGLGSFGPLVSFQGLGSFWLLLLYKDLDFFRP